MYRVTEAQIEYILNDIKQRGVEMEDLQNNLLDHICCLLEQNCKNENDFETEYNKTIKQFFKHELWEIEEETILLLKYKHYYKMKRFLYILLFLSVSYNIYVFSRMGYEYYRAKEWMSSHMRDEKITFHDGLEKLKSSFKEKYPNIPFKKYRSIYFMGSPMSDYEKEIFFTEADTTLFSPTKSRARAFRESYSLDSLASLNNKDITHIFCYEGDDEVTNKRVKEYFKSFKNLFFLTNMKSLLSGYYNDKKSKIWGTPKIIIINDSDKVIYESPNFILNPHKNLSKVFKTLQK